MEKGNTVYSFTYDAFGRPVAVTEGNDTYYYILNQQGDVVAIINGNGDFVVEYYYDAWGRLISTSGTMSSTLGANNPLRYRGYVYDTETGLYYLRSRYYNPTWGRFLNADKYTSINLTPIGSNMFAYCVNNPINAIDYSGSLPLDIRFFNWIAKVAFKIGLSCAINEGKVDDKIEKTAEAVINNIEFSTGIGMGLYGGTTVLDALGIEMGMYVTNWSLVYEDGSFRTTQEAYAGATASIGHLEFGGAESGTKTNQGEWDTTGWFGINPENDVITIFDFAVFAGPGISISLGFDLGSFLWDVSEIWGF
jgi:RHS repeat-associated protein